MKEILTLIIFISNIFQVENDSVLVNMVSFSGYAEGEYFKGNIVYINVMKNMSVDCDCCAVAEDPCMDDIGILISTDPICYRSSMY
mgnify:CR=1 FL=1